MQRFAFIARFISWTPLVAIWLKWRGGPFTSSRQLLLRMDCIPSWATKTFRRTYIIGTMVAAPICTLPMPMWLTNASFDYKNHCAKWVRCEMKFHRFSDYQWRKVLLYVFLSVWKKHHRNWQLNWEEFSSEVVHACHLEDLSNIMVAGLIAQPIATNISSHIYCEEMAREAYYIGVTRDPKRRANEHESKGWTGTMVYASTRNMRQA